MKRLHVFALNRDLDVRHTHLTRAQGAASDLPPLADWLGLARLDLDEIELFPVRDLDDMTLSDYIAAAFAPEGEMPRSARARLDALGGTVLLVPDTAMDGAPRPGAEAVEVATLDLAQPDHAADMAPSPASPAPAPAIPEAAPDAGKKSGRRGNLVLILAGLAAFLLVILGVELR